MTEKHYKVEVQEDHLEKLANARPLQAVAELVWNSVDADATTVDVELVSSDLGMQSISVRDNGHGIPHEEAPQLFSKLGGSWKSNNNKSKTKGRFLHGKDGRGRFKALALGRVADWTITYKNDSALYRYKISLIRDDLVDVRITDPERIDTGKTGVEVKITELHRDFRSLQGDAPIQELSEIFALYIIDYPETAISYQNYKLDPSASIANRETFNLAPIEDEGKSFPVQLEIIEWKSDTERVMYLCSKEGFPLRTIQPRFHTPGLQYSAYLKSTYMSELQEAGVLDLAEMNPQLQASYELAQDRIKSYSRDRQIEAARTEIAQWKEEKIYPYKEEPITAVEKAERKVFDIVALNVNQQLPDFSEANPKAKAFQFRMLRHAIETGPKELQLILTEVLELPERKQQEFAKLLEEASLSNIISASKIVADRTMFLKSIETLLFDDDLKKHVRERSQLHRILAENTWVFGEEFNLAVDDQSLTEVLRKHLKSRGKDIVIDRPVTKVDGSKGIVDLMLSRAVPRNRSDELEHLIVELKAPKVKIGAKEIIQIEQYAFAVAEDERFRSLDTFWSFWVISNDIDKFAEQKVRQQHRPRGLINESDDGRIKVWVKTWSEVLAEGNARLRFANEHLNLKIDKPSAIRYLQQTYDKYLSGEIEEKMKEVVAASDGKAMA